MISFCIFINNIVYLFINIFIYILVNHTFRKWDQINALLPMAEKTIAEDTAKHPALIKPTKK